MTEHETWVITHIFDGAYGCEASAPDAEPLLDVTLAGPGGAVRSVYVPDSLLRAQGLDVGSVWPEKNG